MDKFSQEKRSQIMSSIHSTNTKPEISLRKALWTNGYRYRIHYGKEKIDIAFPSKKIAIFVDGCFWHMCPIHGHMPKSRQHYWIPKLKRNIVRAEEKDRRLKDEGWKIIHIWEHEIENLELSIKKIENFFID